MTPLPQEAKPSTPAARFWRRLKTRLSAEVRRNAGSPPSHE